MSWLRRKTDPIAMREEALRARIQQLETQIQQLHHRIADEQSQPKLRSTATVRRGAPVTATTPQAEPRFEKVDHRQVKQPDAVQDEPGHYNELGLRKYDPFAGLRRWIGGLRKQQAPASPQLVNYLAAGSIHGLKPLRYEKRVARTWFLIVCAFFIVMLWGLLYFYFRIR